MNRRKLHTALTPREVRRISAVVHEARRAGVEMNTLVSIHIGMVDQGRGDPGAYVRRVVMNRIGRWCRDRNIAWVGALVRENYDGPDREHAHILLHIPRGLKGAFRAAVRRWWPGPVGDIRQVYDPQGAVGYITKQMTPQAHFAIGRRIRRETECRRTGAKVAPVLGRRLSMSKAASALLDRKT